MLRATARNAFWKRIYNRSQQWAQYLPGGSAVLAQSKRKALAQRLSSPVASASLVGLAFIVHAYDGSRIGCATLQAAAVGLRPPRSLPG